MASNFGGAATRAYRVTLWPIGALLSHDRIVMARPAELAALCLARFGAEPLSAVLLGDDGQPQPRENDNR